jgi:hypothetical protein
MTENEMNIKAEAITAATESYVNTLSAMDITMDMFIGLQTTMIEHAVDCAAELAIDKIRWYTGLREWADLKIKQAHDEK